MRCCPGAPPARRSLRALISVALATAVLASAGALAAGCSSAAEHPAGQRVTLPPSPRYYVSLGDSLSQGVQPSVFGQSEPTSDGYANKLYSVLRTRQPGWQLVKLGCSGETTETMIHGGICKYGAGSQLAEAERFLREHRGHVGLITIDIGANDPNSCVLGAGATASKIMGCVDGSIGKTTADLHTIMGGLRTAAGRTVPIIAMNYYVPELAGWLDGFTGQEIAALIERLVVGYNKILDGIYKHYGARVANVFSAFHSSDFTDKVHVAGYGVLPRNVATVCEWTWACARWPQGPNEHANNLGYGVMALAFLLADPQL